MLIPLYNGHVHTTYTCIEKKLQFDNDTLQYNMNIND